MARPILDEIELEQVQKIDTDADQVITRHGVPALEGDFLQGLGRRATQITLTGVLVGPEVGEGLKKLRDKFRAAEPVPFVSDITTATRVDEVLIEEIGIRELAGKPERFEYALTLREFIEAPAVVAQQPPEIETSEPPVEEIEQSVGTLIVEVIVEGQPNFDFNQVTVTVQGTTQDGEALSRILTNREENIWTEGDLPASQEEYTVLAVVPGRLAMSGSATTTVRAGQTATVTITLRTGVNIAKSFVVHFWFDKSFIEPCLRPVMREVAAYAQAHPDEKLIIVGHTDLVGGDDYNQSLSERRGRSAYAYQTFGRDKDAAVNEWDQLRQARPAGQLPSIHDTWGVREYQYMLQGLGYYIGNIDENHGPKTDAAIRTFQQDKGLTVNGLMNDETWRPLIEAYLAQDSLSVPENQFLKNVHDGCDSGILKWLGCGEKDPVKNTRDAWRPNRRTEFLFARIDALPCEVPKPVTYDLPAQGAVGGDWCFGPGDPNKHCCFIARETEQPGKLLVQPARPEKTLVNGVITFENGAPVVNAKYTLLAPDGEYLHTDADGADLAERPLNPNRGRPIPDRADENGRFSYPCQTPVGTYILELQELQAPQVARAADEPRQTAKGNVICLQFNQSAAVVQSGAARAAGQAETQTFVQSGPAPPTPVNPTITVASPIVIVRKPHTDPARRPVTLSTDAAFTRSGTLSRSGNTAAVRLFTAATGGTEINFDGTDNVFPGAQLTVGVQLFAEAGPNPSGTMDDYILTLTLATGTVPPVGGAVTATMTAVELTLDIFGSRPAPGSDPPPLSQPPAAPPAAGATDKWFGGRLLSAQDAGNTQERAMVVVRQVQPANFAAELVLRQVTIINNTILGLDNKAQLFDNEVATAGEAAKSNPHEFNASTIPVAGLQFFAEGRNISTNTRDTGFQLGIKDVENDGDRVAITVGVGVRITMASSIAVVKKPHTNPARQAITLRTTAPFNRSGTLTSSGNVGAIRLFPVATGGTEITFNGTDNVFTGAQLTAGVPVFAEGITHSNALDDYQLSLALATGASPLAGLPFSATVTAVELMLDIFMSRTADGVDPAPLPQPPATSPAAGATANDKWFGGRFVHIQDPGNHQGRASLMVRQVQPAAFAADLVLRQVTIAANNVTSLDTRLQIFDNEFRLAPGEAAKGNPHEFASATIPAAGLEFFVEGRNVSAALRDTGFQLGIKNAEADGDRVSLTAVRLRNLRARIPSTPPNRVRLGNGPVPNSTFARGTDAALVASDFDVDFTANSPFVIVENSLGANTINMSVVVEPVNVPVSWSVQRDTRPSPQGDNARIATLSPNPLPTLTPNGGNPLEASLSDDAVGSFHIRSFIDCNNNNLFDPARNNEPFMIMNMVLVHVGGAGSTNSSRAQPANIGFGSFAGPPPAPGAAFAPTSASGLRVATGDFLGPASAGVFNDATIVVIGGGNDGRRGLNNLFAGWINNELAVASSITVPQGEDVVAEYLDSASAPPQTHRRTSVWISPGGQTFTPATGGPAGLIRGPLLDTTNFGNEGTGGNRAVGTEGAVGPPVPITQNPHIPIVGLAALGETWRVQMWDSPGDSAPPAHGFLPGSLSAYRFNLDFRTELCFWTNITGVPGPSPGPITGTPPPVPDTACCLYVSVQTNAWQIRISFTFNAATGVSTPGVNTIQLQRDASPIRLAGAVQSEVRAPISLSLLSTDASS